MLEKIVAYGTKVNVTVVEVYNKCYCSLLVCEDEEALEALEALEAYMLMDAPKTHEGREVGENIVIEFVKGGPKDGYWKVVEDE